jgi:hypothetical protein
MDRTLTCVLLLAAALPLFGLEPGGKAPPFANPDLESRHVLSRDYLGKGWVLVEFFATDSAGQAVVGPYFRDNPTGLTVLLDRYQITAKRYGVSEIPSLFLVDPAGIVVLKQVGFQEGLYERLCALLPALE